MTRKMRAEEKARVPENEEAKVKDQFNGNWRICGYESVKKSVTRIILYYSKSTRTEIPSKLCSILRIQFSYPSSLFFSSSFFTLLPTFLSLPSLRLHFNHWFVKREARMCLLSAQGPEVISEVWGWYRRIVEGLKDAIPIRTEHSSRVSQLGYNAGWDVGGEW